MSEVPLYSTTLACQACHPHQGCHTQPAGVVNAGVSFSSLVLSTQDPRKSLRLKSSDTKVYIFLIMSHGLIGGAGKWAASPIVAHPPTNGGALAGGPGRAAQPRELEQEAEEVKIARASTRSRRSEEQEPDALGFCRDHGLVFIRHHSEVPAPFGRMRYSNHSGRMRCPDPTGTYLGTIPSNRENPGTWSLSRSFSDTVHTGVPSP